MIQLKDLCLHFGNQDVFDHLNLSIDSSDRIGLVGRNGSGKTTLLKALVGLQHLDGGSVSISGNCRVAYMPQEVVLNSSKTILEEAVSAHKEIGALQERVHVLEPLLQKHDADAVHEYGEITARLKELDAHTFVARTKKILSGLGFKDEQYDQPVTSLSVGWQMRVVLAKLLLQDADFYLFDEPTNHLDIVAKDWFIHFLKEASFGFLLVCHERHFLDTLCTKTFELDRGKGTIFYGNYSDFEVQKEHDLETLEEAYKQQQKDIKQKQRFIDRFRAKSSKAKLAKSMERTLDKMERIVLPQDIKSVNFKFDSPERSGRVVLEVQNVGYDFGQKNIFDHVTFQIERGEKVAVVAPNGAGKTTLFNVLCGKYKDKKGSLHLGYNVKVAIFEQEQHKILDPKKTVLEEVLDSTAHKTEQQIRTFLGAFLFGKEEVIKKTKVLSGGERNRVSMVKVLLQDANFLLLDEPTNHLDIPSKEILLKALEQFEGTILFVSHDHDFVNKLATRVLELTPHGVKSYFGNYDAFLVQKREAEELASSTSKMEKQDNKPQKIENNNETHELKKKMQQLERSILNLEKEIKRTQEAFTDIDYGTDAFIEQSKKLKKQEKELATLSEEWEKVAELLA